MENNEIINDTVEVATNVAAVASERASNIAILVADYAIGVLTGVAATIGGTKLVKSIKAKAMAKKQAEMVMEDYDDEVVFEEANND